MQQSSHAVCEMLCLRLCSSPSAVYCACAADTQCLSRSLANALMHLGSVVGRFCSVQDVVLPWPRGAIHNLSHVVRPPRITLQTHYDVDNVGQLIQLILDFPKAVLPRVFALYAFNVWRVFSTGRSLVRQTHSACPGVLQTR